MSNVQPKYKQQIKRKATYNAYYYPDYHYQPIVDINGNRIDWRNFHGEKDPVPVVDLQLKLF